MCSSAYEELQEKRNDRKRERGKEMSKRRALNKDLTRLREDLLHLTDDPINVIRSQVAHVQQMSDRIIFE